MRFLSWPLPCFNVHKIDIECLFRDERRWTWKWRNCQFSQANNAGQYSPKNFFLTTSWKLKGRDENWIMLPVPFWHLTWTLQLKSTKLDNDTAVSYLGVWFHLVTLATKFHLDHQMPRILLVPLWYEPTYHTPRKLIPCLLIILARKRTTQRVFVSATSFDFIGRKTENWYEKRFSAGTMATSSFFVPNRNDPPGEGQEAIGLEGFCRMFRPKYWSEMQRPASRLTIS